MKPATACRQCRTAKRRCTREGSEVACTPCRQRDLTCGSTDTQRRELPHINARETGSRRGSPPNQDEAPTETVDRLSRGEIVALVEIYLTKVHGQAHTVFHPPTLRQHLRNDSVPRALLCAMAAIGSKFSPDPQYRGVGRPLALEAKRLLQADMENICLENIQACILVSMLSAGNCNIASEALFIRMAISMAQIMKLESVANDETCPVTVCETARLVCWTLCLSHHRCFSGLGLPCRSDEFRPTCELPMDELAFASLAPDQGRLGSPRKTGLWAHMVTLVRLSGPVMMLNRRVAERPAAPEELDTAVREIEQQLQEWLECLPPDTQMTVPNLYRQQQNGLGALFVVLHLTFHYYSILLYFSFLESQQDNAPPSSSAGGRSCPYVDRCKHHASAFGGLLHLSRQLDGCQISYPGFSHMITVSSAVLLHTLLLGDEGEIGDARRGLNANFESLVELQQPWPATTAVIGRLMKFQRTCLLSTQSHKVDGWMLRFLLDFAVGLEDRYSASGSPLRNTEDYAEISRARELRKSGRYTDFDAL